MPNVMTEPDVHTPESAPARVALPVEGMECAACAARIERQLGRQPGVRAAAVNYATGEALVEYDAAETGVDRLAATVQRTGYGVRTETLAVPLRVAEGAVAPTPAEVEEALARENGFFRAEVDEGAEPPTAVLHYVPGVADPDALLERLEAAGLAAPGAAVERADPDALEKEREARYRALRRRLVVAAVLSVPVVVLAMAHGALDFPGSSSSRRLSCSGPGRGSSVGRGAPSVIAPPT